MIKVALIGLCCCITLQPVYSRPVSQKAVNTVYEACVYSGAFELRGGRLIIASQVSLKAADVIVATGVDRICGYPVEFARNYRTAWAAAAKVLSVVQVALSL